jgi:aminopeptidase N
MLRLPSEEYLAEQASLAGGANVDSIHEARNVVRSTLGAALVEPLLARYHSLEYEGAYAPDAEQIADRCLRNTCLSYLVSASTEYLELAARQYRLARNMTDRLAALKEIAFYGDCTLRDSTLADFYQNWRNEALVVNQWFQVQAAIPDSLGLSRVQGLMLHEDFELRNPNKVRALVGGFINQNPINFHRIDGAGYQFLGEIVLKLNRLNPQMASRLLTPLTRWRNYTGRAELMHAELARLAAEPELSPDVFEVVTKALH